MARQKGADEIFCKSCGEIIKKEAEICPNCGVRNTQNRKDVTNQVDKSSHNPSQYTTTVSDSWWYGIIGSAILWIIFILMSDIFGEAGAVAGLILLLAWIVMPLAGYFDMKYIRANSEWNPNTVLWIILFSVWLVNVVGAGVYLYRRHEVIGRP